MEYYNLKLEYRNNYKNLFYTNSLAMMIKDYYKLDYYKSIEIVKSSIKQTKTPIELLKEIQKSIR